MSIRLTFNFSSIDNAKSFMAGLGKKSKDALESEPDATTATVQPVDLSGGPAEVALAATPAAPVAPVAGSNATESAASNIAALLGGAPPSVPAAPEPAAPAPAPVAPAAPPPIVNTPAPEAPPAAVDQKSLISAFTALGQTKGRDAIAGILRQLGVTTVLEIKPEHYVWTLNAINEQLQ